MKRLLLILTVVLVGSGLTAAAYIGYNRGASPVRFETSTVTRGPIVANVVASGQLEAVDTVDVGTQVNGIVKELRADFNSVVRKGQVLARLDPAAIQAQIEQAQASIAVATAVLERNRIAADSADWQMARAQALLDKHLLAQSDFDVTALASRQAALDVKTAEADLTRARATLESTRVALGQTVITAPVDGIVIARNVDVGQTLVSKMQAQTLFTIAADLTRMQVNASVDESDVARVRAGQPVTFTVESYPDHPFSGRVSQVRLNPSIDQNVVSYVAVIDVANPGFELRPGMTANVAIRVDSRDDVLRVPSNGLRFKPDAGLLTRLHQAAEAHAAAASRAATAKPGTGRVWVLRDGQLLGVPVQVGLSDGTNSEVLSGGVQAGDAVVTNVLG